MGLLARDAHGVGANSSSLLRATAFFIVVVAMLLASRPLAAQISPGPLSKGHQPLTGTTQCASCHQFGASTPTFKCLDCHKEVSQRISAGHGYHSRLGMKNPNGKECVRCHLEHNGADFPLIRWEPSQRQFDHQQTGYALEGKHAKLQCNQCHTPKNMITSDRALIKYKDATRSFFGLSRDCQSCHNDPHKGQLGNDCQRCHNLEDWKAAKQFDHWKTRYPLTGEHVQVACEKCHKPDTPGGPARYKDMRFAACIDCHTDPHKGSFKQRCEDCHTTTGWKRLNSGFNFDHSKTKYPLTGKHASMACASCHVNGDFNKPLPFANCLDCHKDRHNGQFVARERKGECSECHTVEGWKPSLFGVQEHTSSKYPLEGKHAKVECAKCHIPAGKDTLYKVKFANCMDCHKDAHDGQFAAAPYRNRCEACHTVQDFHRSLFTLTKHRETKFVLTGAHLAVPCNDCHKVDVVRRTEQVIPFHFADRTCSACHADPHHGEFAERMARKRTDGTPAGCEACHNTRAWSDVNGFDHSKTKFPLIGAHRALSCGSCHKPIPGTKETQFKGTTQKCQECHKDPHDGQFIAKTGQTMCADCHNSQKWVPSAFDHDKRTKFPLTGGHANVKCDQCHHEIRVVDDKEVLIYKGVPLQCAACHGSNFKANPGAPTTF